MVTTANDTITYSVSDAITTNAVNGTFTEGRNGTYALDGSYLSVNDTQLQCASDAGVTLDAWVKLEPGTSLSGNLPILSKGDHGYNLKIKNGVFEIFFNGYFAGVLNADVLDDLCDGTWKRLTATVDADGVFSFYYNGELRAQSSTIASAPFDTNAASIGVGTDPDATSRQWPGLIDSVRVMDVCMSADEIANGMAAQGDAHVVYGADFDSTQVIRRGSEEDVQYWGYGGDWDDKVLNDDNFVGNGIINADRSDSAKLQEVNFYDDGDAVNGNVRVVNEFVTTDLSDFDIRWQLKQNATVLAEGTCALALAPQSETAIHLNLPLPEEIREGDDYFLEFSVRLKEDKVWADAGYEIAAEQLTLAPQATQERPVIPADEMNGFSAVENSETQLHAEGEDFSLTLDKTTGCISSYVYQGVTLMEQGPVPNYYRARIDNDMYQQDDPNLTNTSEHYVVESVDVQQGEQYIIVTVKGAVSTATPSPDTITYVILADGEIIVTNDVTLNASGSIKRGGMKISVPEEFSSFTYYGCGPWENYSDRNTGSFIGLYETTVQEIDAFNKYLKPQENGNRTDARFAAVRNAHGAGFMVASETPMSTSLSQYEDEDLGSYRHMYQVPEAGHLVFNVVLAQRGLGGEACGPAPLGQYQLANGSYTHTFRIVPFVFADNDALMEESKKDTM